MPTLTKWYKSSSRSDREPQEIGYRAGGSLLHYSTIFYNCKKK
uniref:Uncharacterized protein n=1 Tax=Myoviridae sp. ctKkB1 TaxID=2825081 RepID=A0A8S5V4B3_9CAUD|nr:MAG TPA: hypothetical protein [Myoviridae sp. ctKkB1]